MSGRGMESAAATTRPMEFNKLDAELWLLGRLQSHLAQIFTGETDCDVRRERVRRAIIIGELDSIILGKRAGGGSETYAQAFERLYGEPLHKPKLKGKP